MRLALADACTLYLNDHRSLQKEFVIVMNTPMKGWFRIRTEVIVTAVVTVTPKHPYNAGRGKSVPRALSPIL